MPLRPCPSLPRIWACLLLLLPLLTGCGEEPLPQRKVTREDCLQEVKLERLKEALTRCDQVVALFPADPSPLNDRFLLHTLSGNEEAACRDITRAVELARKVPAAKLDPLLSNDLRLRQASCRD